MPRAAAAAAAACAAVLLPRAGAAAAPPHILFIVADDLGYNDLGSLPGGMGNGQVVAPAITGLIDDGVFLSSYYTFKICSPTRASINTGRYPWSMGWYDMSNDHDHCTANYTLLPQLLRAAGYKTHAIGKWDIGFVTRDCHPTAHRHGGYDTFLGYYEACDADYYYWLSPQLASCGKGTHPVPGGQDMANCSGADIGHAADALNGTYNRELFTDEARRLIMAHDPADPFFLYLAFQNIHLACGSNPGGPKKKSGTQAPCATAALYPYIQNDQWKMQAAMATELDYGVGNVTDALRSRGMWDRTLVGFVSDNGGQLDHCANGPYRGGKHTFWEGGVRVVSFLSGPALPAPVRGTAWDGIAHSSDWYRTLVEGVAGGAVPADTGPAPVDGFNLWPAVSGGGESPRAEVVHQVNNSFYTEKVQAIRSGRWKLIRGNPGDDRTVYWPAPGAAAVAFGQSGGTHEEGTGNCRAGTGYNPNVTDDPFKKPYCSPYCLFDIVQDPYEENDLSADATAQAVIANLSSRLDELGAKAPPPEMVYAFVGDAWKDAEDKMCEHAAAGGAAANYLQPVDL